MSEASCTVYSTVHVHCTVYTGLDVQQTRYTLVQITDKHIGEMAGQ